MLVRCVTLSLDRFENQVDMKGEAAKAPRPVGAVATRYLASSQELLSYLPDICVPGVQRCSWLRCSAVLTSPLIVLPVMNKYNIF